MGIAGQMSGETSEKVKPYQKNSHRVEPLSTMGKGSIKWKGPRGGVAKWESMKETGVTPHKM